MNVGRNCISRIKKNFGQNVVGVIYITLESVELFICDHLCSVVSLSHQWNIKLVLSLDWTGCRLEADWAREGAGQLLVGGFRGIITLLTP